MSKASPEKHIPKDIPAPVSSVPDIPFQRILAEATCDMVRKILERIRDFQETQEPSLDYLQEKDRSVVLRMRVDRDDVILPPVIRKLVSDRRSDYFDLILDGWFKNLIVEPKKFSVTIRLASSERKDAPAVWLPVEVPYSALRMITIADNHLELVPHFDDDINDS